MVDTERVWPTVSGVTRQTSLLATGPPEVPGRFGLVERIDLGRGAWIDHRSNWLPGADAWLERLRSDLPWLAATRPMFDRVVDVPRLISNFDPYDEANTPDYFLQLRAGFEQYYGREFPKLGCNWYRSGSDSVAWHADKVARPGDSIVAIVAVGERRPFLIRPIAGGPSRKWLLGDGDLFVLGGTLQAHWQHAVPKVKPSPAGAGERISIMVRG